MSDLHDTRIEELEAIILAAPMIAWRYDVGNWPGTDEPLMPEKDRNAANEWLGMVYKERGDILKKRRQ
jgi:hypothetical protein